MLSDNVPEPSTQQIKCGLLHRCRRRPVGPSPNTRQKKQNKFNQRVNYQIDVREAKIHTLPAGDAITEGKNHTLPAGHAARKAKIHTLPACC